jgi:hypothetical protein
MREPEKQLAHGPAQTKPTAAANLNLVVGTGIKVENQTPLLCR